MLTRERRFNTQEVGLTLRSRGDDNWEGKSWMMLPASSLCLR